MIKREFQSKKRYLLAFLIATFIFIIVFALSYSLSYLEFQRISGLQGNLAYKIFEDKLDYSLFEKGKCSEKLYVEVSEDLGFQGRIIDDLEKKLGKNNEQVLLKKKFYSLIELEHFEFVKMMNDKCNLDINTILFFYSNEKEDLEESEDVGRLLSIVYNRNKNLMIYSFDINLQSDLIDKLKNKYNVEEISVIINENIKIIDIKNIEDIEKHLN